MGDITADPFSLMKTAVIPTDRMKVWFQQGMDLIRKSIEALEAGAEAPLPSGVIVHLDRKALKLRLAIMKTRSSSPVDPEPQGTGLEQYQADQEAVLQHLRRTIASEVECRASFTTFCERLDARNWNYREIRNVFERVGAGFEPFLAVTEVLPYERYYFYITLDTPLGRVLSLTNAALQSFSGTLYLVRAAVSLVRATDLWSSGLAQFDKLSDLAQSTEGTYHRVPRKIPRARRPPDSA